VHGVWSFRATLKFGHFFDICLAVLNCYTT
jgi:hypothetical protein